MPGCLQWASERHNECVEWEDHGYESCAEFRKDCCDWWPCSWGCEVVSWFCYAFVWISKWVCVVWNVITTVFCVLWDVVTLIVANIIVLVEGLLGWFLSAIAALVELLESIPILGTLIRWIINFVTFVFWTVISIPDFILGLLGIRPEKKLRACTIILKDENGVPTATVEQAIAVVQLACNVYKRDANVRIVPSQPFQFSTGFGGAGTVTADWITVDTSNSDADLLDAPCSAGFDWLLGGSKAQLKMTGLCFFDAWRRVVGYGAPVTIFVNRFTSGALGCSLLITDYVTVMGATMNPADFNSSPRTWGHEVGHSCTLWHVCVDDDVRNMMATRGACDPASPTAEDRANPRMDTWQVLRVRASKHVSYF